MDTLKIENTISTEICNLKSASASRLRDFPLLSVCLPLVTLVNLNPGTESFSSNRKRLNRSSMLMFASPKQIALAAGTSESTIKRLCDRGLLPCQRTPGGHRRIPVLEAVKVLRERNIPLVRPEVLAVVGIPGRSKKRLDLAAHELAQALEDLNVEKARGILFELYCSNFSIAEIGDLVIAKAFEQIGDDWACGRLEIYRERGACQIVSTFLTELDHLLPPAEPTQPLAVGGTLPSDHYVLASQLVHLVFRQKSWRSLWLGSHLPTETLVQAIRELNPAVFWLSVSYVASPEILIEASHVLYQAAVERGCFLVLGGRGIEESLRLRLRYSAFCKDLAHLAMLLEMLPPPQARGSTSQ